MRFSFGKKDDKDSQKKGSPQYTRQKSYYEKDSEESALKEDHDASANSPEEPDALIRLKEDPEVQELMEEAMDKGKVEDKPSIHGMLGKGVSTLVRSLKKGPRGSEHLLDDDE